MEKVQEQEPGVGGPDEVELHDEQKQDEPVQDGAAGELDEPDEASLHEDEARAEGGLDELEEQDVDTPIDVLAAVLL